MKEFSPVSAGESDSCTSFLLGAQRRGNLSRLMSSRRSPGGGLPRRYAPRNDRSFQSRRKCLAPCFLQAAPAPRAQAFTAGRTCASRASIHRGPHLRLARMHSPRRPYLRLARMHSPRRPHLPSRKHSPRRKSQSLLTCLRCNTRGEPVGTLVPCSTAFSPHGSASLLQRNETSARHHRPPRTPAPRWRAALRTHLAAPPSHAQRNETPVRHLDSPPRRQAPMRSRVAPLPPWHLRSG
jgi:hypothetical protein